MRLYQLLIASATIDSQGADELLDTAKRTVGIAIENPKAAMSQHIASYNLLANTAP